jgi:hypothetical protein
VLLLEPCTIAAITRKCIASISRNTTNC